MKAEDIKPGMLVREIEDGWIGCVEQVMNAQEANDFVGVPGHFKVPIVVRCTHEPGSGNGEKGFIVPPDLLMPWSKDGVAALFAAAVRPGDDTWESDVELGIKVGSMLVYSSLQFGVKTENVRRVLAIALVTVLQEQYKLDLPRILGAIEDFMTEAQTIAPQVATDITAYIAKAQQKH